MKSEIIKLKGYEVQLAANAGVQRALMYIKHPEFSLMGASRKDIWKMNIIGALGECALAKYLDVYWSGCGDIGQIDVGQKHGVDVRTVDDMKKRLIVHQKDEDSRQFWLVCGWEDTFHIRGFIYGADAKQPKWWTDPNTGRPAFFVPHDALQL